MGILGLFVNAGLVLGIVCMVEFVKKHWAGLNSKLIPLADVVVGILLSIITNAGKVVVVDGTPVLHPVLSLYTVIAGIACGIAAAASYSVAMNVTKNVGGTAQPVEPAASPK